MWDNDSWALIIPWLCIVSALFFSATLNFPQCFTWSWADCGSSMKCLVKWVQFPAFCAKVLRDHPGQPRMLSSQSLFQRKWILASGSWGGSDGCLEDLYKNDSWVLSLEPHGVSKETQEAQALSPQYINSPALFAHFPAQKGEVINFSKISTVCNRTWSNFLPSCIAPRCSCVKEPTMCLSFGNRAYRCLGNHQRLIWSM